MSHATTRTDTPVARTRKPVPCKWCRQTIEKGQAAVSVWGVADGDVFSGRFHPECHLAELAYWKQNPHEEEFPDEPQSRPEPLPMITDH